MNSTRERIKYPSDRISSLNCNRFGAILSSMKPNGKTSDAERRLKLMSMVARLGHEAFAKGGVDAVVHHILNNSRSLAPYDQSCLIDFRSSRPVIAGVMGQSKVNGNSEYCVNIRRLVSSLRGLESPIILTADALDNHGAPEEAKRVLTENFGEDQIMVLPLRHPDARHGETFLWLVHVRNQSAPLDAVLNLFHLLARHYAEALWYRLERGGPLRRAVKVGPLRRVLSPRTALAVLLAAFIVALFVHRVPLKAVSRFEIVPESKEIVYAPYGGTIAEVDAVSGERVISGDVLLKYDTEEILYDKAFAQKRLAEILAELDLAKTQSFRDVEMRGRIKILDLRRQQQENKIEKNQWFLDKSVVRATAAGTVLIDDKDVLIGKKIEAGDKLCEILSNDNPLAEIRLNEKDAIVLGDTLSVALYPHVAPETKVQTKVISISPVPFLSEHGAFCYRIKLKPLNDRDKLFNGMRGVANLHGKKVSLGYYLFRSLLVWWRKL